MNPKTKRYLLAVIILILCSSITTTVIFLYEPFKPNPIPLGDYSYTREYAEFKIKRIMQEYHVPGVAISIIDNETVIMENYYGFANVEDQLPLSNCSIFKIGSISKVFTAIEIMRLVEEGLIDLDTPLITYLPDFNISSRCVSDPITVRHILCHRSGLPRNDNLVSWHWDTGTDCLKTQMESLNQSIIAYPAGYRFKYSNIGFDILGCLIEKIRGKPFAFYMTEKLLHPIGMNHSHYLSQYITDPENIATGYFRDDNKNIAYSDYDIIELASGGMLSKMSDMQAFIKFLVHNAQINNESLLNSTTLYSMFEPQYRSIQDPQEVGFGFFVNSKKLGKKIVFHAGINLGRTSIFTFIPETKQGLILIGNHDDFDDPSKLLAFELLELMIETKTGETQKNVEKSSEIALIPEISTSFVGKYTMNGEITEVFWIRGKLKLSYKGLRFNMMPIGNNTFIVKHFLPNMGEIQVSFNEGNTYTGESDMYMVISLDQTHNIYCPRVNEIEDKEQFAFLIGEYDLHPRIHSIYTESDDFGKTSIVCDKDVLVLPMFHAILISISSHEFLLMGGEWDGETMYYQAESGVLIFQHLLFFPT